MKKAYAKHKAKVEFVGIDCRDTEEKWRKAVAEHDMPWLHVRNEGKARCIGALCRPWLSDEDCS